MSASTLNAGSPQVIKMKIVLTNKQRKELLKAFASGALDDFLEDEDHALDKLFEKLLG